jgi:hypothetical protein
MSQFSSPAARAAFRKGTEDARRVAALVQFIADVRSGFARRACSCGWQLERGTDSEPVVWFTHVSLNAQPKTRSTRTPPAASYLAC